MSATSLVVSASSLAVSYQSCYVSYQSCYVSYQSCYVSYQSCCVSYQSCCVDFKLITVESLQKKSSWDHQNHYLLQESNIKGTDYENIQDDGLNQLVLTWTLP